MSGNLSKMEKLQHRHLTLLRALQEEGIKVKCDRDGKWEVHCPVVERMALSGLKATRMIVDELATMPLRPDAVQESCRAVLNQALREDTAAPVVPVVTAEGCVLDLQLTVVGQHASGALDGKPFTLSYGDIPRNLLEAVRAAILAAPAKA